MATCSSCGCATTTLARQVECAWIHSYDLNEPGSPTRRDVIAKTPWEIEICRPCTERRLEESLRTWRQLGFFIGPSLVVGSVVSALILFPLLAKAHSPLASVSALLFCGGGFIIGLIMIPVGLILVAKATNRLTKLKQEAGNYTFTDDDAWEAIETEGERIIKALESGKRDFHGDFTLPQAQRPEENMGSRFYYTILRPEERK